MELKTNHQRYQAQLDNLCRKKPATPHKPLTGLEKQALEDHQTTAMWSELRRRHQP